MIQDFKQEIMAIAAFIVTCYHICCETYFIRNLLLISLIQPCYVIIILAILVRPDPVLAPLRVDNNLQ